MTPLIALDLSLDGIVVMSRAPDGPDHGKWWREGIVRLDADDMSGQLRRLRARCAARVGEEFTTVLIIPDSQLLFTSLERDDRDPKTTIRSLLKGRTPYPVEDLAFDFVQRGDRLQVAVVALETLLEAESFAAGFGFRPVALVGNPKNSAYPCPPDFGLTGIAAGLLDGGRLTLDLGDGFTVVAAPGSPEMPKPADVPQADPAPPDPSPDTAAAEPQAAVPAPRTLLSEMRVTEPDPAIILPELTAPRIPPAPPLPPKSVIPPGAPLSAHTARARVEPMPRAQTEAPAPQAEALAPQAPGPGPGTGERAPTRETTAAPSHGPSAFAAILAATPRFGGTSGSDGTAAPKPDAPPAKARVADGQEPRGRTADEAPADDPPGAEKVTGAPEPDFARRADAPTTSTSDAPGFSTRRRAPAPETSRTEPGLTRITPRLSRPVDPAAEMDGAAPPPASRSAGSAPKRPAGLDDPPTVSPGRTPPKPSAPEATATPSVDAAAEVPRGTGTGNRPKRAGFSGLAALTGGAAAASLGRAAKGARRLRSTPRPAGASAGQHAISKEAQNLTLPGLARERGTAPTGRAAGGRLGLYLTLSLLALLAAVAIWSVVFRGNADVAALSGSDGPAPATAELLPPPVAPGAGTATGTSISELPPVTGGTGPAAPATTDATDLALLLPDSRGGAGSPVSDQAAPPDAPVGATPEGSVESDAASGISGGAARDAGAAAETAAEIVPDIAVVTTEAEPFELPRQIADAPETEDADQIYLASIDPVIAGGDAVALPRARVPPDTFSPQTSPAPAGTEFDTGTDGLVTASAAGTLAPGGYSVIAGRPATSPAPRPGETAAQQAAQSAEDDAVRAELARLRPVQRPEDSAERVERLTFNGLTREELTRTRPAQRPASIAEAVALAEAASTRQAAAVQAAASAAVASLARPDALEEVPTPEVFAPSSVSRFALAQSDRPRERPRAVEQDAARIVTQRREQAAPAAAASTGGGVGLPAADSGSQTVRSAGGSVARAATQSNVIRLREVNLIGVYGSPSQRRALVRLSNGRYVKVEVGDRLERGRVVAIGESEVVYQQGGRNYALRMPQT